MKESSPSAPADMLTGRKKILALLPPFLFSLYNILFLFSHNLRELVIIDQNLFIRLILPVTISWIGVGLLLLLLNLIIRNLHTSGIVASLYVMMFFSFGHFQKFYIDQVVKKLGWDIQHVFKGIQFGQYRLFFLAWLLAGLGLTIVILVIFKRRKEKLPAVSFYITIVASLLLLITLVNVTYFTIKRQFQPTDTGKVTERIEITRSHNGSQLLKPDIFYIILDSYSAASTLAEFGYDNSEFLGFLQDKGFYVANRSNSNYAHTTFSLASTLNMKYITYLKDKLGANSENVTIPITMIENSQVMTFLKSRGYQFVFMGTPGGPISRNRFADKEFVCFKGFLHDTFVRLLLETTMLEPFIRKYINLFDRDKLLCQLDTLPRIREQMEKDKPIFVLAHLFTNHEPFIFEADGKPVSNLKQKITPHRKLYINQLIYTNMRMKKILTRILADARVPPIIIVQGDHGPLGINPESKDRKYQISHRILNVYHLPGEGRQNLYDSISPVNTFRIIFNQYFGTNYELLEDRHFFSKPPGYSPYQITEVTGIVKYPQETKPLQKQ